MKFDRLSINKRINLLRAYAWTTYFKLKLWLQHTSLKRRLLILAVCLMITCFVVIFFIVSMSHKSSSYPVQFAKPSSMSNISKSIKPSILPTKLTDELNQVKSADKQRYQHLQDQLTAIESKLGALASDQSVSQLQQSVTAPNPTLLGKMDNLQSDVNTIIHQTAKKVFLNPKAVSKYFQLVAIQGFSDGMRAIIDVDGNQTTLGVNEVCPACRGWRLKSMDFTKQIATFENPHHQFVILQAK